MKTVFQAIVCAILLIHIPALAAPPPAQPATPRFPPLRWVVLPFQNATGDTNWDDWGLMLPALTRTVLEEADNVSVIGGQRTMQMLKRDGGTNSSAVTPELARQVALDLRANAAVWCRFYRQTNQWIVQTQIVNPDTTNAPASVHVTAPGWNELPEQLAIALARQDGRSIRESDRLRLRKYGVTSEETAGLLARAVRLEAEDAPVAVQEPVLRRLLDEDPHCGLAYLLLHCIYDETERTNELAQSVREFVRQCPDLCEAHVQYAWLLAQANDESGANRELHEALRLHPGCPMASEFAYRWLGGDRAQWEETRQMLEASHAARPNNTDLAILLAAADAQSGDGDGAAALLADISDLPEEDESLDIALLVAATLTREFELAGREIARLGPQSVTNEAVRAVLYSITLSACNGTNGKPVLVITPPRTWAAAELNDELNHRLTAAERQLAVNPLETTPAIAGEARRLTVGLTNDVLRALALFAEVSQQGRGTGTGGTRTANQTLAQANDPQAKFSCQEYAKLFVALARSLGLESWLVHIDRAADGNPCYHDCAVVFLGGCGILVDPTWRVFGIGHQEFRALDDLQAISHQAMQPSDPPDAARLRMGLKLNPDDRWTQLQYARGMAQLHDFDAAAGALARAQRTGNESWETHEAAGELAIQRQQWKLAVAELQRALIFSPSNALVHFELSQAYNGLEDRAEATEHMEAALQLDRGEMPPAVRHQAASQVPVMKSILRSNAGDATAHAELQRLADAGNAMAQIGMAETCFAARQFDDGLNWLRKAAAQGGAQAEFDYAKNLYLLHPDAGQDVVLWLTRAAKQGHPEAQYRLGEYLYEGRLVPRDNVAAGQWILLASAAGQKDAKFLWREMELFMSADELAAARKRAANFKPAPENSPKNGN